MLCLQNSVNIQTTVSVVAVACIYIYIYVYTGNTNTSCYELTSIYGHDTFLLDVNNVGTAVKVHVRSHDNHTNLIVMQLQ